MSKSTARAIQVLVILLVIGTAILLIGLAAPFIQKHRSVHLESLRKGTPSHVLLVALDSRGAADAGLPDSIVLIDLKTRTAQSIPRDWKYSKLEQGQSLTQKYAHVDNCEPFCGIEGVYAFNMSSPGSGIADGLNGLARAIEKEYGLASVAYISFDLTWAHSFLSAIAPIQIDVRQPVPVGGKSKGGNYGDVEYYISPIIQDLSGKDLYWFARARFGSSNENRMERQLALLKEIRSQRDLFEIAYAALKAKGNLWTDLELNELPSAVAITYQPQPSK